MHDPTSSTNVPHASLPAFQLPTIEETVKQERKSNRWVLIIFFAAIVLGYFGGKLVSGFGGPPDPDRVRLSKLQSIALLATIPISAFIVILVHETGHVVGGRIAGLRFLFLIAGPLKVTRSEQGLKWQVNRSIALMGGLACCVPSNPKTFLAAMKWMIAGGPLGSLLFTALCYVLSINLQGLPLSPSGILFVVKLLQITAFISLLIAVVTIYPGTSAAMKTDGRQLIELFKSNPQTRRQNLVRLLVGQSLAGTRPSEWDPMIVAELDEAYEALESTDETLAERVTWSSIRAAVAVDRKDFETAHHWIQFHLTHAEQYPVFARGTLFLEAALFEARVRQDADAAEALIQAAPEGMLVESYLRPAAEAEVCRLRGEIDKARSLAEKALRETQSALDAGSVVAEREHLLAMIGGN